MIPESFFSEIWSEFVHGLDSGTHFSREELFSLIERIYPKCIRIYESKNFQFLTKKEREWLESEPESSMMESAEKLIEKAESENILIRHENEWVVRLENAEKEKTGTKWEIVQHHWDKRTGF